MFVWYRALDRLVRGVGMSAAVRKTLADQLGFLPIYLGSFVGLMAALRGDSPADIARLLRRDMGPMLATSYAIWPAVQIVNFRFVPLRHRVLVINVVCLFWNTYVSWQAEQKLDDDDVTEHNGSNVAALNSVDRSDMSPAIPDSKNSDREILLSDDCGHDYYDSVSFINYDDKTHVLYVL